MQTVTFKSREDDVEVGPLVRMSLKTFLNWELILREHVHDAVVEHVVGLHPHHLMFGEMRLQSVKSSCYVADIYFERKSL